MKAILLTVIVAAAFAAGCTEDRPVRVQAVAGPEVQGVEWFRQTGCTACHSLSVYNEWNLAAAGPDLSLAVEDVPHRFGMPLDDFFRAPSGTMAMVLSTRIPLTPDQRESAINKLKAAYRKHQDSIGARPVASH